MKHIDLHLSTARALARLLDSQFSFLGYRFGLDPLFDIIPGIGTLVPTAISFYIVWIGYQANLPTALLARMIFNVLLDGLIGSIPLIGIFLDAAVKANQLNVDIIQKYIDREGLVIPPER